MILFERRIHASTKPKYPCLKSRLHFWVTACMMIPVYSHKALSPAWTFCTVCNHSRRIRSPTLTATINMGGRDQQTHRAWRNAGSIPLPARCALRAKTRTMPFPSRAVKPTVFMNGQPASLPPPQRCLPKWLRCITAPDNRWLRCDIKATS